MSILIKGMEMPTGCPYCLMSHWERNEFMGCEAVIGKGRAVLTDKEYAESPAASRPNWCPLVPVPPHGRLGDLDELAKVVLNWIATQEKAYPNEDSNALSWRLGARAMGHQIYRDIEATPTIIPAEEGET